MALPGDLFTAVVALLVGYLVGSVPVSGFIVRAAGVDTGHAGGTDPGFASVWSLAGPGPGLLALTGELAKGVLPVALGMVTWSWSIGWIAGVGALLGAGWPLFGRLPGAPCVATLAGVAIALAPAAGVLAVLLALLAMVLARLVGRNGLAAAIVTGLAGFAVLFLAGEADPARLAALGFLYLVAAVRHVTIRR